VRTASTGDRQGAIATLLGLLARLDGDPSPADWMVAGPERDGFRNTIVLLVALLHLA
jgi:hypothetical protein